jgi:glycerol-3-phosphate dehydrogenase
MKVALVEKDDFSSGTSSRSSKPLHGGLRYLKHLEFGLVREGLVERRENLRIAPHLVAPLRFVVPSFRRHPAIALGLFTYDVLAVGSGFPRHHHLGRDEIGEIAPALRHDVRGGFEYWDATVDDARLVWTIVRSAIERGAVAANHARVVGLARDADGVITGARVRDALSGEEFGITAKAVLSATGVWADDICQMEASDDAIGVRPSKGIHLLFPRRRLPVDVALLLPTFDKRFVFVVPFVDDTVLVGTTDDDYDGPLDAPSASDDEIDYLLSVVNDVLAEPVSRADVISSTAGLRPLVRKDGRSKDVSRRHLVHRGPGGLVTITGGKLTAWRPMAKHAVDTVLERFKERPKSRTDKERLAGAAFEEGVVPALRVVLDDLGMDISDAERLYNRYGSHAAEVLRMVRADPRLGGRLHPDAPYLIAEGEYAIRFEMAMTVEDVLERRLRLALTTPDHGAAARDWVSERL